MQRHQNFYAITAQRHFEPPLLKTLLKCTEPDATGLADGAKALSRCKEQFQPKKYLCDSEQTSSTLEQINV